MDLTREYKKPCSQNNEKQVFHFYLKCSYKAKRERVFLPLNVVTVFTHQFQISSEEVTEIPRY